MKTVTFLIVWFVNTHSNDYLIISPFSCHWNPQQSFFYCWHAFFLPSSLPPSTITLLKAYFIIPASSLRLFFPLNRFQNYSLFSRSILHPTFIHRLLKIIEGKNYANNISTTKFQEFSQLLREEGVTYLNIDSPVRGRIISRFGCRHHISFCHTIFKSKQ